MQTIRSNFERLNLPHKVNQTSSVNSRLSAPFTANRTTDVVEGQLFIVERLAHISPRTVLMADYTEILLVNKIPDEKPITGQTIYLKVENIETPTRIGILKSFINQHSLSFQSLQITGSCGNEDINNQISLFVEMVLLQLDDHNSTQSNAAIECTASYLVQLIVLSLEASARGRDNSPNISREMLRQRIFSYISENLSNSDLSPENIALGCKISQSYLYKIFGDNDTTVCRWILQERLRRCKEMLTDQAYMGVSISKIAFDLGFNNSAHFSCRFRQQYKVSPSQMRSEAKKRHYN